MRVSSVGAVDQVAGELLDREPVERLVGVERADHVVAEQPDVDVVVAVIAGGVGEPDQVEPEDGHPFADSGARPAAGRPAARRRRGGCRWTKASTSSGVGGKPIRSKLSRRIRVGRSASGDGSSPSALSRARRNRSIASPAPAVGHGRHRRPRRRDDRPSAPSRLGPLRDPSPDQVDLVGRQRACRFSAGGMRSSGSSEVIRSEQLALVGLAGDDDRRAVGRSEQAVARDRAAGRPCASWRRGRGTGSTTRRGSAGSRRLKSTRAASSPLGRTGRRRQHHRGRRISQA